MACTARPFFRPWWAISKYHKQYRERGRSRYVRPKVNNVGHAGILPVVTLEGNGCDRQVVAGLWQCRFQSSRQKLDTQFGQGKSRRSKLAGCLDRSVMAGSGGRATVSHNRPTVQDGILTGSLQATSPTSAGGQKRSVLATVGFGCILGVLLKWAG